MLCFLEEGAGTLARMSISSSLVHRAEIRFHEAADALRPFVGCFWVVTAERGAKIRVVPDGSTAISIQVQRDQRCDWFLRGPLSRIPAHTLVRRRIGLTATTAFHDPRRRGTSPAQSGTVY